MKNYIIRMCVLLSAYNSFSQCNVKFTCFLNTTTNDVQFYLVNQNLLTPDSIAYTFNLGDGSAPIVNTSIFIHHYSNQVNYYVCLSGNIYYSSGSCSFTFCDTIRLGSAAPCFDTLLSTNNLSLPICPLNFWCPVCGCDGVEYRNSCEAQRYGVKKYASGRCPENNNIWDYGIYVNNCAGYIEAKLNGFTSTCYLTTGWYFGDGDSLIDTTNAIVSVNHYYLNNGLYNLCTKIIDPTNIMQPQILCTPVSISNANMCHADFNYSFKGDTLFLTNSSTGNFSISNGGAYWGISVDSAHGMSAFTNNPYFYLPGGSGSYEVCLIIQNNDCSCYHDTCIVVTKNLTSVTIKDSAIFSIYPNPSNGKFIIEGIEVGDIIEIVDITGRIIYNSISATKSKFQINLDDIVSGIYFYRIITTNNIVSHGKLIIK